MDAVQWYPFVFKQLHSRHGSLSLMIYNNNNNNSCSTSSVSATPPVIEIYFLIGNDSTPRELSLLFPLLLPPLGGVGYTSHLLWPSGHLLSTPTGASMPFVVLRDSPPLPQHHNVVFHPLTPL